MQNLNYTSIILFQDQNKQENHFGPFAQIHSQLTPFIWTIIINISIFFALYRYRIYTVIIHIVLMFTVTLFTVITSLSILLKIGIPITPIKARVHVLIGVIATVIVLLQAVVGCISKFFNFFKISSILIYRLSKFHMYTGYIITLLCKFQVYHSLDSTQPLFWILIAQQFVLFTLFLIRKNYFPQLQQRIQLHYKDTTDIEVVSSLDQLQQIYRKSGVNQKQLQICIYGNYIYDIEPMKLFHPPGFQIIRLVKNREIDRFMFGMIPNQYLPKIPPCIHSFKCLSLLGTPLAVIKITSPFKSMPKQIFDVTISQIKQISAKGHIYQIYLKCTSSLLTYEGYKTLSQLGRYYTLTINQNITRIYTAVNFIMPSNIRLMKAVGLINSLNFQNITILNQIQDEEQIQSERGITDIKTDDIIPLLMKVYSQGNLPKMIVEGKAERLQLSPCKGQGLGTMLSKIKAGTLLIISGGTGINPFCDLIDLLYKDYLLKSKCFLSQEIIHWNPILIKDPFKHINFTFLIACNNIQDIHPITLNQLKELAEYNRYSLKMRIKQQINNSGSLGIKLVRKHFQLILDKELKSIDVLSKVWLSGPPKMCVILAEYFQKTYPNQDVLLLV